MDNYDYEDQPGKALVHASLEFIKFFKEIFHPRYREETKKA